MKGLNLFGETVDLESKPMPRSMYQQIKFKNRYRKSNGKEKCKICSFHHDIEYNGRHYHKCELIGFSSSVATDIRINSVCNKFF